MPWVRLHASKAYFDMAYLIERFPDARATFNFTPSLLLQLNEVVSGSIADLFLEHAMRPATELTPGEQAFLLQQFFAAELGEHGASLPALSRTARQTGDGWEAVRDWDRVAKEFTVQDWRDLQVWHNLAWFGYGAVARYPRLATLRQKDRGFTERAET